MSYIFAVNVERGQKVRRTVDRGGSISGWGDFKEVADVLKRGKDVDILLGDGRRLRNLSPTDVLEVADVPVQP
jgi:hypothetical protein